MTRYWFLTVTDTVDFDLKLSVVLALKSLCLIWENYNSGKNAEMSSSFLTGTIVIVS